MYPDSELIMISGLQHLAFCQRQWALIHLEQKWTENILTIEGKHLHQTADSATSETRNDIKIVRSLKIASQKLGLTGIADIVEFHKTTQNNKTVWQPFPIEYKRGRARVTDLGDQIQLCAQAICLQEMLQTPVPEGARYYGTPHKRLLIQFTSELKQQVSDLTTKARQIIQTAQTPPPRQGPHCKNCSLLDHCMPQITQNKKASQYIQKIIRELQQEAQNETPS